MAEIFETLSAFGVIPVITIENAAHAVALADALAEGGLGLAEITFRTEAAAEAIAAIARARPDFVVGAGTVLSPAQARAAQDAGARFALAPGFDPAVVAEAGALGLPFVPGVVTASEIQAALGAGCRLAKFFPAEQAGGRAMLRALAAPFAHTGLRFNPTGGIGPEALAGWLGEPHVAAVGGSWIAPRAAIAAGDWAAITASAAAACAVAQAARG